MSSIVFITFLNRSFQKRLLIYVLAILVTFTYGCSSMNNSKNRESKIGPVLSIDGKDGTRHFIIIGFGIVRVNGSKGETAAMVVDSRALGINVSDQPGMKFGAGYSSSTVLTVPDGTRADDVRMEVIRRPFGSLKIITDSAKLKDYSNDGGKDEK